jgi:hypothetical protein
MNEIQQIMEVQQLSDEDQIREWMEKHLLIFLNRNNNPGIVLNRDNIPDIVLNAGAVKLLQVIRSIIENKFDGNYLFRILTNATFGPLPPQPPLLRYQIAEDFGNIWD